MYETHRHCSLTVSATNSNIFCFQIRLIAHIQRIRDICADELYKFMFYLLTYLFTLIRSLFIVFFRFFHCVLCFVSRTVHQMNIVIVKCWAHCRRSSNVLNATLTSWIMQHSTTSENWRCLACGPGGHWEMRFMPLVQPTEKTRRSNVSNESSEDVWRLQTYIKNIIRDCSL